MTRDVLSALAPAARGDALARFGDDPLIVTDVYAAIANLGCSLVDLTWEQQRLHESRRWSVVDLLSAVDVQAISASDRNLVWNAGRAELTTKPGADRLERQSDAECRRWLGKDDRVAAIMQACGTWSRYWNEEEAHHETAFNRLSVLLDLEPIADETFIEFRQVFPDDDMLRTLTLLAISEIVAAVNYANCSRVIADPGLKALFKQVGADEIQHMNYFIAFAKALVDSGAYHAKEAFSVAHLFMREGGELYGSTREEVQERDTHVNWWDHLEHRSGLFSPEAIEKKQKLIYHALEKITGIKVSSPQEVEDAWLDLVGC